MHLFFGLRHPDSDFLYQNELSSWQTDGKLAHLSIAVSRGERPQYVQDVLRLQAPQVVAAIRQGARIMVCGGRDMARGVTEALTDILKPAGLTPPCSKPGTAMSKTSTELIPPCVEWPHHGHALVCPCFAVPGFDTGPVQAALQQAAGEVDAQMSTWNPDSDLMRLNRAPVNTPVVVPDELAQVLALGVAIGRASGGAFDIGMGDAVQAWGFGPEAVNEEGIRRALSAPRRPAHETLELAGSRGAQTRGHHA